MKGMRDDQPHQIRKFTKDKATLSKMIWDSCRKRQRKIFPEIGPNKYGNLVYDKGGISNQLGKNVIINKSLITIFRTIQQLCGKSTTKSVTHSLYQNKFQIGQ